MLYESYGSLGKGEPLLYFCGQDKNLTPGVRYGPVVRDVFIAECCTAGYGSVIVNRREFPLRAGDCFFLFPGDTVVHTADTEEPREGYWCAFDGEAVREILTRAGISSASPFAPAEAFGALTAVLSRIVAMQNENDPGAELRRTGCLYELLGILLRGKSEVRNLPVRHALGYMEMHYHEKLDIATLAAAVGLERTYFSTLFRAETGKSPHAYLTSLRIRRASVLLRTGECSVAEAAESVGLDPRNFARLFKSEMGISPREFIKKS